MSVCLPVVGLMISMSACLAGAGEALPVDPAGRLNEANLARASDNRIRRCLEGAVGKAYQLTPEQRETIRQRLEALKREQIRYSLETAAERDEIARQLFAWLRRNPGTRPSGEAAELQERLRAMNRRHPLFNEPNIQAEVENLLPQEQVKAGRERLKALRSQPGPDAYLLDWLMDAEPAARKGVQAIVSASHGGWEAYVESFCSLFEIDSSQRATASSVLREGLARLERYRHDNEEEFASAKAVGPDGHTPLFVGVEMVWEELRRGLDAIPTKAQVEKARAKSRVPTPALATRPTDLLTASQAQMDRARAARLASKPTESATPAATSRNLSATRPASVTSGPAE